MNTPTPEQIAKLPKWTQDYLTSLERERNTWKESALRFATEQPESPFFVEEWDSKIKRFIPSPRNHLTVQHAGVELRIYLPTKDDHQRLFGIELTYGRINTHGDVAVMPRGGNSIQLLAKENMR